MTRNTIVVQAAPAGIFKEGTVSGTPKPGTCMEIVPGTAMDARGRHTWRAYQPGTDGEQRLVAVLRENQLLGKNVTDAYVDGDACYLYCPLMGDELQVLVLNAAGTSTADSLDEGDILTVDSGTGKAIPTTATPEMEPFQVLEAHIGLTEDTLILVHFTGH